MSRRNCSIAAAIAAASSGEAGRWRTSMRGRGGACLPLRLTAARLSSYGGVPELPVFDHDAVLARVSPGRGDRARARRVRASTPAASGRCRRRSTSTPRRNGDFRAMPARGGGLAILKWVTSFPGNPRAGLPVVMGVICVSSRRGRPAAGADRRARGHRAAHRRGRRGRRPGAGARGRRTRGHRRLRPARRVGGALPGRRRVRARASASTPTPTPPARWPASSAGRRARRDDALACDVVTCVTPGSRAGGHARPTCARACT